MSRGVSTWLKRARDVRTVQDERSGHDYFLLLMGIARATEGLPRLSDKASWIRAADQGVKVFPPRLAHELRGDPIQRVVEDGLWERDSTGLWGLAKPLDSLIRREPHWGATLRREILALNTSSTMYEEVWEEAVNAAWKEPAQAAV